MPRHGSWLAETLRVAAAATLGQIAAYPIARGSGLSELRWTDVQSHALLAVAMTAAVALLYWLLGGTRRAAASPRRAGVPQLASRTRRRLAYVIERSDAAAWGWDIQTDEIIVDGRLAALIGHTLDDLGVLRRTNVGRFIHEEDEAGGRARLEELIAGRTETIEYECRLKHKTGAWVWVAVRAKVVERGRGGRPRWVAGTCVDVSGRKQVELELAFHRQAISDHTIVSETDAAGTIIYANSQFEKISGFSQQELLGKNHRILHSGYHPKRFWRDMFAAMAKGGVWQGDICNRRKDGTLYWVSATNVAMRDDCGKIVRYVSIRTDITAIKQAQQRIQSIFSAMSDGVLLVDQRREIVECNRAAETLLGSPPGALRGTGIDAPPWRAAAEDEPACPEKDHPAILTLRTGRPLRNIVQRIQCVDGKARWIAVSSEPIRDDTERVVAAVVTLSDVTERRQQEERLALTVSGAGLGTWDWNVETDEIEFNDLFLEMLGYAASDIGSTFRAWQELLHPDDAGRVAQALGEHLDGKVEEYRCEMRMRRADGSWMWLLARGRVAERDTKGRALRAMGVCLDISKSKSLEENLMAARAAAEQASLRKANSSRT